MVYNGYMQFELTISYTLMMLAFAIPGYIAVKCKAIKPTAIAAFAFVLLYVNQPFLSIYSFMQAEYSLELLKEMGIVFGISSLVQVLMLTVMYFIFLRKARGQNDALAAEAEQLTTDGALALFEQNTKKAVERQARNRVYVCATAFGNVGFLGVPLLEALLPTEPKAVLFSAVYIVSMNILCWTLGLTLLTGDKSYLSVKKLFINPPMLALLVALPIFFTGVKLPSAVVTGVTLMAKMTAPLCMLVLGMRFATVDVKDLFSDGYLYFTSAMKLVVLPLLTFAICYFLPIDGTIKTTLFILGCMPTASVVLNLSEIRGAGQKTASGTILMATIFSIVTIPLLLLLA